MLRYFNFEPSYKLRWCRAQDLFGSQIPATTGGFELRVSCIQTSRIQSLKFGSTLIYLNTDQLLLSQGSEFGYSEIRLTYLALWSSGLGNYFVYARNLQLKLSCGHWNFDPNKSRTRQHRSKKDNNNNNNKKMKKQLKKDGRKKKDKSGSKVNCNAKDNSHILECGV